MMIRLLLIAVLLFGLWMAFGPGEYAGPSGPAETVTLAELAAKPARWDGRRVTLSARVIDRATLMGLGGVLIGDGEGHQILALGSTGAVVSGDPVTVTGEYRLALALSDIEVPVILIKPDRDPEGGG